MICAVLLCAAGHSNNPPTKDPWHLIVEGSFVSEKNIHVTVYKQNTEGAFVSDTHEKCRKYYSITCNVGEKYILRFEDKHHNVKFLMVDATKQGYYAVDVDFSKSYDAKLFYNPKLGYALLRLTNSAIGNGIAQK